MRRIRWISIAAALALGATLAGTAQAAIGDHVWSKGFPAGGSVSVDGAGNLSMAGGFFGTVDFGGGPFTSTNPFSPEFYLARFDQSGAHLWSRHIVVGGFGGSLDACGTDPAGNTFIAGTFQGGSADFGGGVLSGSGEMFIAAFDPAGTHLWSMTVGPGFVRSIAASSTHACFTGYTYGTMDFGGGPLTSAGNSDAFLGAMTTAGAHGWSTLFGDASDQAGLALAVTPSGDVLLASGALGTTDFGGGPLTAAGKPIALARFSGAGAHQWSKIFAGSFTPGGGPLRTLALTAGASGQAALAGEFSGSIDLGGGTMIATASFDMFVATFDAAGAHQWSVGHGGLNHDGASGVALDGSGNAFVSGGFFSASMPLGGTPLTHSGGFGQDFFAAAFDGSGAHLWSRAYAQNGQTFISNSVFPTGDMLLFGAAASGIDFGGGGLADADGFLVRLEGISTASVEDLRGQCLLQLGIAHPNPFHAGTRIPFSIRSEANVRLEICDVAGRRISTLVDGSLPAGRHVAHWDGRTSEGMRAPSGVYFSRLTGNGTVGTSRLIRLR
jgi:hypothetical protein